MTKIAIVTDGSCDIPQEVVERHNIHVIPFRVLFGDEVIETFGDWGTLTKEEFYDKVKNSKVFPTSAVPPPKAIVNVFEEALKTADTVIAILLSKKFSGMYQAALKAAELMNGADITFVDSMVSTSTLGALVLAAAKMAENGKTKDEILEKLDEYIPQARLLSVMNNIDATYRSGRVGWAKKYIVSRFKIKPIINFQDGEIVNGGSIKTDEEVVKRMKHVAPIILKNAITDNIFIWHVRYPELANELFEVMQQHNDQNKEIFIQEAGPVVGTHVGEKTIGIMYIGDFDKDWILKMKEA